MTPAQLRAFAAVARTGTVTAAARELGVSDAAVSQHVAALRRELGDQLFHRARSGLAFTPGGLRLAARAVEMLGLQDRTRLEIASAGQGRRLLRVATSSLFAEYAAPGLIDLFASRAVDLEVELSIEPSERFPSLLAAHATDVTIGPPIGATSVELATEPFLRYEVHIVCAPSHRWAGRRVTPRELRTEEWALGPSAAHRTGMHRYVLDTLAIPEDRQRIFQSHAAALEEVHRGAGVSLALGFAVRGDIEAGRLARVACTSSWVASTWHAASLPPDRAIPAASELMRFITTPRATQAMITGTGSDLRRFRPSVHITLWR
jgi:LysR family transcriptional regulator, low CO2-responsive transcriptional regulator